MRTYQNDSNAVVGLFCDVVAYRLKDFPYLVDIPNEVRSPAVDYANRKDS